MRQRPVDVLLYPMFLVANYSFPSIHAATSFSVLPILDREFKKVKWFWILFAILISFSRVYVGVHYFSDIVFGAIIGYLIGFLFVYLEQKYKIFNKFSIFRIGSS